MPTQTARGWSAVSLVARVLLGQVFVLAALNKLVDPQAFAASIDGFQMTGLRIGTNDAAVRSMALFLPWMELIAALALICGFWTRAAALAIVAMLAAFSYGLWSAAIDRGLALDCGCFGDLKGFCRGEVGVCNLVQNGVLAGLGVIALVIGGGRASADALFVREPASDPAADDEIDFG
ncbi:MAG: DoxX family protein [Phycisphaerales bacterium]